jgi:maleate cis-trans isomerase
MSDLSIRPYRTTTNLEVIEFYRSLGFKIDEVTSMGKRLEVDG